MVAQSSRPEEAPTVIGADAVFKGELSFQGSVRIDGKFEGGIQTPGSVLVSPKGSVKAEVHAGSITVDGSVEGNVTSGGRVQLNATSKLKGDVRAAKLKVAEGATWSGRCDIGPNAGKAASATGGDAAMRQISDAAAGKK